MSRFGTWPFVALGGIVVFVGIVLAADVQEAVGAVVVVIGVAITILNRLAKTGG